MARDEKLDYQIATNIRSVRADRQLSQIELAARCNWTQGRVSEVERGVHGITLRTLRTLCDALGCASTDLLGF